MNIEVKDAKVYFPVTAGYVKAVDRVNVTFESGKITGLIGESGCGKSVLGMYLLGLLPDYARRSGEIWYQGRDLERLAPTERRRLRGRKLGLIPQNPGDSLNPVRRIHGQILESLKLLKPEEGREDSVAAILERFGFSVSEIPRVQRAYPFELSGGMQQRAVAAMGIASHPDWILADEPSKGLDMTLREQMYETLRLVKEQNVHGMIIITHDLVLAEKLCDEVAVMYAGQILEKGRNVLRSPLHPYTKGLLDSLPERGMHPMKGIAPAPGESIQGCRFANRCPRARETCNQIEPPEINVRGQKVRCFLYA
jgi:peptide/nickel transport system ATP-binding protein